MAKRYKDLNCLWCDFEQKMSERAILEIREMLTAMGFKEGDYFELPRSTEETRTEHIVGIDFPETPSNGEYPELWYMFRTRREPFEYNKSVLNWHAETLVLIHSRVRKTYNRFLKEHKTKKEEM